jgi:hypothetical protein
MIAASNLEQLPRCFLRPGKDVARRTSKWLQASVIRTSDRVSLSPTERDTL